MEACWQVAVVAELAVLVVDLHQKLHLQEVMAVQELVEEQVVVVQEAVAVALLAMEEA
jgi:hypothetical protein